MRPARIALACLAVLALAACNPAKEPAKPAQVQPALPPISGPVAAPAAPPAGNLDFARVEPRDPGTPGGLPDDRTPLSEAPFTPQSAPGGGDVVQTYFAL